MRRFGEARNSYWRCSWNLIRQYPRSVHHHTVWELGSTLFDHHCTSWNRQELLASGQPVVHTRSSSESTPLVIVIFPEACKVHFRLLVSDIVILEPVVTIQNSVRIHPPQTSMSSHLPALLKKQTTPHSCPAHLLLLTCLHEMMWHLSYFFKGHRYFFQEEGCNVFFLILLMELKTSNS